MRRAALSRLMHSFNQPARDQSTSLCSARARGLKGYAGRLPLLLARVGRGRNYSPGKPNKFRRAAAGADCAPRKALPPAPIGNTAEKHYRRAWIRIRVILVMFGLYCACWDYWAECSELGEGDFFARSGRGFLPFFPGHCGKLNARGWSFEGMICRGGVRCGLIEFDSCARQVCDDIFCLFGI